MFRELRYRWEWMQIDRAQKRAVAAAKADVAKAKAEGKPRDEVQALRDSEFYEYSSCDQEKADLRSRHLQSVASDFLIPLPSNEDKQSWESAYIGYARLTREAQRALLLQIRAERKDRTDLIRSWLPVAAAIISALAAWTAILLRK